MQKLYTRQNNNISHLKKTKPSFDSLMTTLFMKIKRAKRCMLQKGTLETQGHLCKNIACAG